MAGIRTVPTRDEALANARRLLEWAEDDTDLAKMERYDELARSWMTMAAIIQDGADMA